MEALLGNWLVLVSASLLLFWVLLKLTRSRRQHVKDLRQKAVLITGCDSGFGHELAKRLDALGVTVYAGVLFPDGDGATKLKGDCSSRLQLLHLDVTRDDHVTEAFRTVTATLGDKKLWAVVNNAGIATAGGFEWTSLETMKNLMDVNTFGPVRITTAFLPLLKESHGRVVIVASIAGYHSAGFLSAYCMSKHAVVSFADCIRRELRAWSVSVHVISPWLYRTNIADPTNIRKALETNWETGNAFKDNYPSTYFANVKKGSSLILWLSGSKEKIYEVVDDMEDAAIGLHPKVSYVPGVLGKLVHFAFSFPPGFVLDYSSKIIAPPSQEGAKNAMLDFVYTRITSKSH